MRRATLDLSVRLLFLITWLSATFDLLHVVHFFPFVYEFSFELNLKLFEMKGILYSFNPPFI